MNQKSFAFNGTAGGFFVTYLVTILCMIVPLIGPALGLNYMLKWLADNVTIRGEKIQYAAGVGETFVFILINALLIAVTLGIYVFWYVPKVYRYIADHVSFVGTPAAAPASPAPSPVQQ